MKYFILRQHPCLLGERIVVLIAQPAGAELLHLHTIGVHREKLINGPACAGDDFGVCVPA